MSSKKNVNINLTRNFLFPLTKFSRKYRPTLQTLNITIGLKVIADILNMLANSLFSSEACAMMSRAVRQTRLFGGTLNEIITSYLSFRCFIFFLLRVR